MNSLTAPPVGPLFLLSQVGAHAARLFAERLALIALKPHHAGIMRLLAHNPGLSQQTLSSTLGVFASQLVLLLDDLERHGLVDRRASPDDRRSHRLHLTPAGEKAAEHVQRLTREIEASFFAPLSKRDIGALEGLLRRVGDARELTAGVHPAYRDLKTKAEPKERRMAHRFKTKIRRGANKNVTGIVVPPAIVEALGNGKKPAVTVTLNGYTYRSTIATMGGDFMIGLSAEHRTAAGLTGDETLEVALALDTEPRATSIPDDLKKALVRAKVLAAFESAAPSRRKEFIRQVETAKAADTRSRRITKIVESLA